MTNVIYYATTHPLTDRAKRVLKRARALAYGEEEVDFIEAAPGPGTLNLGHIGLGDDCVRTINAQEMVTIQRAEYLVAAAMRRYAGTFEYRAPIEGGGVLWLDLESHSVDDRWDMAPRDYVRLAQFAHDEGPVQTTTDHDEMYSLIEKASCVVAHMGHAFDLSVLYGKDSMKPLYLASQGKIFDSKLAASVLFPAPEGYTGRDGRYHKEANAPAAAKWGWLSLDNLAFQFGVPGKEGDLKALAEEFGGFGMIPLDDPRFMAYALQDVVTLRELTSAMLQFVELDAYDRSVQYFGGINAQISRNGLRVDVPAARHRVADLAERKAELLNVLSSQYGFPTTGKAPWRTKIGRAALLSLLADGGIIPSETPGWPLTKTGNISLGGEAIIEGTKGTDLEETGLFLAELMGQRPLAQQAIDYTRSDGKVHPEIDVFQRSGRSCLPETHRLVTKRGILHVDDVVVGDETLDHRNRWVRVNNILRYRDAPIHTYEHKTAFLESTPEHRWVQRSESRFGREVKPIVRGSRMALQLTPDSYPFDANETWFWSDMTERERTAALVGFLVTDGHASDRSDSHAGRFVVYQTENKFYERMRDFVAPWTTTDYSRPVRNHPDNIIHEIRLRTPEISELLEREGLNWVGGLRHSNTLLPWALTLTQSECLAFLTACYMSDGTLKSDVTNIATLNPNTARVMQFVAYRCGKRSHYRVYQGSAGLNGRVSLTFDRVYSRNLPEPTVSQQDVWCVSTDTGTFSAWFPEGRWAGPYLTGNSITEPGLTTWSSRDPKKAVEKAYFLPDNDDEMLVEFDFSQADARIVAAYSGDVDFAKRFEPGADAHEITGRAVFGGEYDNDPKEYRQTAKALGHAYAYRARARKLAATSKQPLAVAQKFVDAMDAAYPDVLAWQTRAEKEGNSGWITNDWGRTMPVERGRSFTQSSALLGQSGTASLMADGLIRMFEYDERLIRWVKVTVHDAILMSIPKSELDWVVDKVVELMSCHWKPKGGFGQEMFFPVAHGKPGTTWERASHG